MKELNKRNLNIAFWISIVMVILPKFLQGDPCAMCLINRSLFQFVALFCFLSRWYFQMKNVALALNGALLASLSYHFAIATNIIKTPSFCLINKSFFNQVLSNCNQADPLMIGAAFFVGLITFVLIAKS